MKSGNAHLDNADILKASYGAAGKEALDHLRNCLECSSAVDAASAWRRHAAVADPLQGLTESFWQRQQAQTLARAQSPAPLPFRARAFALSVALLILAAVLLTGRGIEVTPSTSVKSTTDARRLAEDEMLLRDIHLMVHSVEPRALAPAGLLLPRDDRN